LIKKDFYKTGVKVGYYLQLTGAQDRLLGAVLGGFAVLTIISPDFDT